jgi:shikimate dehydrogenase
LREEFPDLQLAGARVVLIGTGGAGRTVALRLAQEEVCAMTLIDIDPRRSDQVAREIRAAFPHVQVMMDYPAQDQVVDLLINATPLGLKPDDPLPVDEARFALGRARFVYDLVYRPAETRLLRQARAAGCRAANGLGMLLYQGAAALELWSGGPAPAAIMRRALEQNVYGH